MLADILDNLPNVLMYFIPGYIFLLKRKSVGSYKKDDEINLIIKSVGISAVIKLLSGILLFFIKIVPFKNTNFVIKYSDELIIVFYIFVAYLLFYIVTYIEYKFENCYKQKLIELFKEQDNFLHYIFGIILYRENKPNVWNKILSDANNKQIRVYLKNSDTVYMGFLKFNTIDPEEGIKEICLNKFTVTEKVDNWEDENKLFKEKDCFFEDEKSFAYITSDNIERIEIIDV